MKTKLLLFSGILALQTAWILGTTVRHEHALSHGNLVVLECRPVDPRDLLRGDYITLAYKIDQLKTNDFEGAINSPPPAGTTVYAALESRGRYHEVVRASLAPLSPHPGQVIIQGKVRTGWGMIGGSIVNVDYGIGRYYVPEGKGNERGAFSVEAAVSDSGEASIKRLLLDGKPFPR